MMTSRSKLVALVGILMMLLMTPTSAGAAGWYQTATIGEPAVSITMSTMGIALLPNRDIIVSEPFRGQVKRFSSTGQFLGNISVEEPESGDFNVIGNVAIAADGSLWGLSSFDGRITHFDQDSTVIDSFGTLGTTSNALAIDPVDGTLLVSGIQSTTIHRYDQSGHLIASYGAAGSGNGQLQGVTGITIMPDRSFWIADQGNNRLQHMSHNGTYLGQFAVNQAWDVTSLGDGTLLTTSTMGIVSHYADDGTLLGTIGSQGPAPGQLVIPQGVIEDPDGTILVTDTVMGRIQRFTTGGALVDTIGTTGPYPTLRQPMDAIAMPDGTYWVMDLGADVPRHYAADGSHLSDVTGAFPNPQAFSWFIQLSLTNAPDGSFWEADSISNQIRHFTGAGTLLATIGSAGGAPGQFTELTDIARAADGSLYTIESGGSPRVQHLQANGTPISSWGSAGNGAGQFQDPTSLSIGASGDIYVFDQQEHRLQRFHSNGSHVATIIVPALARIGLPAPGGTAIAADEQSFFVADTYANTVTRYGMDGAVIESITHRDIGGGGVRLPAAISIAHNGDLVVTETLADRVSRWRRDDSAPTFTVKRRLTRTSIRFTISAIDADAGLATKAYSFDGGTTWGSARSLTVGGLSAGDRVTRRLAVRDAAGNVSPVRTVRGTVVTRPPRIVTAPDVHRGTLMANTQVIRFVRASDLDSIARVIVTFRGHRIRLTDGVLTTRSLPQGRGVLRVRIISSSGEVRIRSWRFVVDRTAPRIDRRTGYVIGAHPRLHVVDGLSGAPSLQLHGVPLGTSTRTVRIRDRAGNARTTRVTLTRRISLARPRLNADLHLGYTSAGDIHRAFDFDTHAAPWYLHQNESRQLVREAQWRLQLWGYLPRVYGHSGTLDIETIKAIKRFQRASNLPVIATVGPRTRRALDRRLTRSA